MSGALTDIGDHSRNGTASITERRASVQPKPTPHTGNTTAARALAMYSSSFEHELPRLILLMYFHVDSTRIPCRSMYGA